MKCVKSHKGTRGGDGGPTCPHPLPALAPHPTESHWRSFRETGVWPGRPHSGTDLRCPWALPHCPWEGPGSPAAGQGEGGGSSWSGLLRWGKEEERGSSKERLTRFGGGCGYRDDVCVCRLIYFSVCWPGGRATPLGGCGEAGARAALLLLGVSSPTLAFRSIM